MLKSLRRALRPQRAAATIPDGIRLYAIGDIHGRRDLLDRLIDVIEADDAARGPAEVRLLFLGDLVDRGPDSAGVVARALEIAQMAPATRFLMGNHEEVFLKVLEGDEKALRFFCKIGGRETILSYGIAAEDYDRMDYAELLTAVIAAVPAAHRDFLQRFEDMVVLGDYAFVHAGIRPGVALADQRPGDLRWIREPFLDWAAPHEKIIVHGHSISPTVEAPGNRIGIDTGAYLSDTLTAAGFERHQWWELHN